jgi:hypothetical protein
LAMTCFPPSDGLIRSESDEHSRANVLLSREMSDTGVRQIYEATFTPPPGSPRNLPSDYLKYYSAGQ